jgi:DNA-binding response OmpR family regulator
MNILIVEDEVLLALELECELEATGHNVVGHAMSSAQAISIADNTRPDLVFLDIHLLDGPTGVDVGRHLARRQIPFVFVTGNLKRIPDDFAGGIGALEKPYSMNGLHNALTFVVAFLEGRDGCSIPAALALSPATLSCLKNGRKMQA